MENMARHDDCVCTTGTKHGEIQAVMPAQNGGWVLLTEYTVRCIVCGVELYVVQADYWSLR